MHDTWVSSLDATPPTIVSGFQGWIQDQMEKRLAKLPSLGFDEEGEGSVKIAVTTLAFNNAEIIHMLRLRGAAIKAEDWDL